MIEHSKEHQNVGLFDESVLLYGFHTQNGLIGGSATFILLLIKRREFEKAIKLLKQACMLVLWDTHTCDYITPMLQEVVCQTQLFYQIPCSFGRMGMEPIEYVNRDLDIPLCHVVRIGVVVYMLMPLIRAN